MAPLQCQLDISSNALHLQQLYTGLSMLAKQQKIQLKYRVAPACAELKLPSAVHPGVIALKANGMTLAFDMSDAGSLHQPMLEQADLYFKRSYAPELVNSANGGHKVRPYGLNYWVLPDFVDGFCLRRALAFYRSGEWLKQIGRTLDTGNRLQYSPRLSDIQAEPAPEPQPRILFLARSWDTDNDDHFQLSATEQADRRSINEMRAECIRQLRKEFGMHFTGGLLPTDHAKANYNDCVVGENGLTAKRNYLQLVKQHSICVATTGLHGSIGWKFGEYVALSRAIVSEPLCYQVPGDFAAEQNYLQFATVEQCLEQVGCLMDSKAKREQMMQTNQRYYQQSVRPDQLVWNCLQQAVNG
jgi:hypothetical protein